MCIDADSKIEYISAGMRNGLIVIYKLSYEADLVVSLTYEELGFHTQMVLCIRLSKDGQFGISGGIDQYVALWSLPKKLLL